MLLQEIAVRSFQHNQEGWLKPGLEVCEFAKQVMWKQEVEQSLSVTRRELLYKKFSKMEPPKLMVLWTWTKLISEYTLSKISWSSWNFEIRIKIGVLHLYWRKIPDSGRKKICERIDVSSIIWNEFVTEFNQKYFNPESLRAQQIVFLNLKQEENCNDWSGQEIW